MSWLVRAAMAATTCVLPSLAGAATTYPIYENRDEPGRNPYQELQYGCNALSCTLTYKAVPTAHRRVITNVACDQFVPSGGNQFYVTLGNNALPQVFIPLSFVYSAPYNGGEGLLYTANVSVLAYYSGGQTPVITLLGSGVALANAHCNLSGYDIKS